MYVLIVLNLTDLNDIKKWRNWDYWPWQPNISNLPNQTQRSLIDIGALLIIGFILKKMDLVLRAIHY